LQVITVKPARIPLKDCQNGLCDTTWLHKQSKEQISHDERGARSLGFAKTGSIINNAKDNPVEPKEHSWYEELMKSLG
jgi:hypothetical protein